MARVPGSPDYQPYPGVEAENIPSPELRIPQVPQAFGVNIGEAVGAVGGDITRAGNELFSRAMALQQVKNANIADDADTEFSIKAGKLHADYNALEGKARSDAFDEYAKNLQKLRQDIREKLPSPAVQRMYDTQTRTTVNRTIFNGAGAAASGLKDWTHKSAMASLEVDVKTVEDSPNDDVLFNNKLERVREKARQVAVLSGDGPGGEIEKDLIQKYTSKLFANRIVGMSRTDPFQAAKYLDSHKQDLTGDDFLKVDNTVRANGRATGSVNIANQVFEEGAGTPTKPQMSLSAMEDEVRKKAKEQDPNDPLLATHAISALRGRWNQNNAATKEELNQNIQIIDGAIRKGVKNEQELRADPVVAAAIDAIPNSKQLDIPGRINRYNAAANKTTNDDNFMRLKGLSNNNVTEFLETDLTKEPLSKGDMNLLMNKQDQLKKTPTGDPRVNRAVTWLRGSMGAQLQALDVYHRTNANKDQYDHFTGALQSALDTWQEGKGKPPTYKEVTEEIGPQVVQQRTESTLFGLWNSKKPFFEQDVPNAFAESVKRDIMDKGGAEPTDEQIYKAYVRTKFNDLYGKKKSTPSD